MKNLFQLRSLDGEEVYGDFERKRDARRRAAGMDGKPPEVRACKVSRGPDHWRGPSKTAKEIERTRTIGRNG